MNKLFRKRKRVNLFCRLLFLFAANIIAAITFAQVEPASRITKGIAKTVAWKDLVAYDKTHKLAKAKSHIQGDEDDEDEDNLLENQKHIPSTTISNVTPYYFVPAPANKSITQASGPCTNFRAMDDNQTSFPPDVHGAVGFDFVMTTLNTGVQIQDKYGAVISTVSLASFWSPVSQPDLFDPKIVYDQLSRRFVFTIVANRSSASSSILLAISQTDDPTGNWYFYQVDADPGNTLWFDYPSMGFCDDKLVITGNLYTIATTSTFSTSRIYVFDKSLFYGGTFFPVSFFNVGRANIVPAISFDFTQTQRCLTVNDAGNGQLRLYSITGPNNSPSLTDNGIVDFGSNNGWSAALTGAPQAGSASTIDIGDNRMLSVILRDGYLWWANNIGLPKGGPTMSGYQFSRINPGNLTWDNFVRIFDQSGVTTFAYPNLSVNNSSDVVISHAYFSSSIFPSAGMVTMKISNAASITGYNIKTGESSYVKLDGKGRNRWGDYTATSIDPSDDKSIWAISEYAWTKDGIGTSRWSTWWAKFCSDNCTADVNASGTLLSYERKKFEASNTIQTTNYIISGAQVKYDAGNYILLKPGFYSPPGTFVRAFIEGCGGPQ